MHLRIIFGALKEHLVVSFRLHFEMCVIVNSYVELWQIWNRVAMLHCYVAFPTALFLYVCCYQFWTSRFL